MFDDLNYYVSGLFHLILVVLHLCVVRGKDAVGRASDNIYYMIEVLSWIARLASTASA